MADQWGRQIYNAIKGLVPGGGEGGSSAQLVEANYDRRDENGVEVPGVPDANGDIPQPPVGTSFLQKSFDVAELHSPNNYSALGGNLRVKPRTVFGYTESQAAAGVRSIWGYDTRFLGYKLTIPKKLAIRSFSNNDSISSSGARTVQVYGFDSLSSNVLQNEIVELNGVILVETLKSFVRVTKMVVRSWGSAKLNIGMIFSSLVGDQSTILTVIPAKSGISHRAGFYVPSKKSALITRVSVIAKEDVTGDFTVKLKTPNGEVTVEKIFCNAGKQRSVEYVGILVRGGLLSGTDVDVQKELLSGTSNYSARVEYIELDDSLIDYANIDTDLYYDLNG